MASSKRNKTAPKLRPPPRVPRTETPLPRSDAITFDWRRCKDRPHPVYDQPVLLDGKLYFRGDLNRSNDKHRTTVRQYTPVTDQWAELPDPPLYECAIATLNGQLLMVGGGDSYTCKPTNTILTFDAHSQEWVQSYPVMPTALTWSTAIGHQDYLIVASGWNSENTVVADVNILNTSTNKWITAEPLPTEDTSYRAVLIEDSVYLVGQSTKCLLRAHVPTLTSRASDVWETLENAPLFWSTPVAVDNTLLTVGGSNNKLGFRPFSNIHMYDPTKNQWTRVGDLPEPMTSCRCAGLCGELLVLGGWDNYRSVYVAKMYCKVEY